MRGAYRNYRGDIALGDIITHINGERVRNNDEYYTQLERYQAGDTVTVTTLLGKEEREYEVTLEQSR
jgi:S1-C subfamily serine protease